MGSRATVSAFLAVSIIIVAAGVAPPPASAAAQQPRETVYKVSATLCGDGSVCNSIEISDGASAMVNVLALPTRGEMRGKFTFRVMQKAKGGSWRMVAREAADVSPWAASKSLYYSPSRTTQYRFILEPACYTPGTKNASCKLSPSSTVTIIVREVTPEFRVAYLDSYVQVERGKPAFVGALFQQKTRQGTWTPYISPTTISLQRLAAGKWRTVDSERTDYGGVSFRVEPSGTRQYRIIVGKFTTPNVTVAVTPTSAAKLTAKWPPLISAFDDIRVDVRLLDKSGDPWVGGTELLLQYRTSRVNAWTTIGRATWKSDEEVILAGRVQGAGYYRVLVSEFSLQREAFYS